MKQKYKISKSAKVGDKCICPSCGSSFTKTNYQQAFCKTKKGTVCKDKYWNMVIPNKRNNTTRISPANRRWTAEQERIRERDFNPDNHEHPFSTYALGQD